MPDRVRLSGFVDEEGLADRYAAADAAVFLSEYEGFGLPALEAASRGVPLVVSRAPSLGEIFGRAALVVSPRDESAVAAALDRVLTEPALRATLVAAGRQPRPTVLVGPDAQPSPGPPSDRRPRG